jgi:hypothetical protein
MKVFSKGYERFLPTANGERNHRRARAGPAVRWMDITTG